MKLGFGISSKLFLSYTIFIFIFYGTLFILYVDVHQMMRLSDDIITKHHKISSASKKMIESLLNMEENEKKYFLLKKSDYLEYFFLAKKEFEANLNEIIQLESSDFNIADEWKSFSKAYLSVTKNLGSLSEYDVSGPLWIPEEMIDEWIEKINASRLDNELNIISANIELHQWGRRAIRYVLGGLGISIVVGLIWILFIAKSMIRPLRELRKGIRSITKERFSHSIDIHSKDEFGELATAFNEMAARLKEEERMRAEFITTLSHEIRTPLTSIRESVNLIVENVMGPTNRRQTKFLKIASAEIGRICELLNHLMQVSRLEEVSFKVNPQASDPLSFVSQSIDHLNPVAKAKGIHIKLTTSPTIPKIMGDSKHLQQVMLNLLGNAIKFSQNGCKIEVFVTHHDKAEQVEYAIADNGRGIPKAEQSLIFNKYYRAKEVRKHMDGVGLGLNISKQIILAHGGKIWVNSEAGKGSTFVFTLSKAKAN
ncbi:MAG: two-component sensor histidine kinase [Deltaproteobacteria bacterium]|nr:MAG: two-component sensor histidine kinase [Deltaproteobacteria bacterium]